MRSEVASSAVGLLRGYGTVKWFGGLNNKTGRENHFGFIGDLSGEDVFLHKREWQGESLPAEGQLVTYLKEERDGKFNAQRAESLDAAEIHVLDWYLALCVPLPCADKKAKSDFQKAVEEKLRRSLANSKPADLRKLVQVSQQPEACSIFGIAANGINAAENYALLMEAANLCITDAAPWSVLSSHIARHYEAEIAAQLGGLEPQTARDKCSDHLTALPVSLRTYLIMKGVFTDTQQLSPANLKEIYDYVGSVLVRGTVTFPDYIRSSFDVSLVTLGFTPPNPILRDIGDNLRFKKSLFEKNADFIDIYNSSTRLQRNVDTFVLNNLLGLVIAGNDRQVVYSVFMQRLWEALMSKSLLLEHQAAKLLSLFPSCGTLSSKLSCEAVHWSRQNLYLCRGRHCVNPQIQPGSMRHFLDFNIFDWLSHYGINYSLSDQPQNKDFPVKLAGYFNRLREILPRLHCRSCGELMLPNMRYARTQYKELVKGVMEVKEMAAAYRLTVFHCNNDVCEEFDVGYYISHCIGFGCYHIIDSRDLKQRCSKGRYICQGCGSCCQSHGQTHPAGFCPECGDELEVLSETVRGKESNYRRKYAKCKSPSCSFTIPTEDLPPKFSRFTAKNNAETIAADEFVDLG